MEIKLAREMGMCFGVKMTLDQIAVAEHDHPQIDTLGTLVHNPQLVEQLSAKGVQVREGLETITAPTMAITAHGAAPMSPPAPWPPGGRSSTPPARW